MKHNELERIWQDIEIKKASEKKAYQRMVCVDMLYRVYIGSIGMPSQRYLSIEIPEDCKGAFDGFIAPKGFTFAIEDPAVAHAGYVACVLRAASYDQNDVFTIVAIDILQELRKQSLQGGYIKTLKRRIAKWRDFFKNSSSKTLSDEKVVGLWGELTLMCQMHNAGVITISDLWNGPIKAAQDFQGKNIAIEVKTTTANTLEYANISSEMQLDDVGADLFLATYRIARSDSSGTTLPQLIEKVAASLNNQQKSRLFAALLCLGYDPEDSALYNKGYVVAEQRYYQVTGDFPRLLRGDMPQGVHDLKYKISLGSCSKFLIEWNTIVSAIKEYEHGES